MEGMGMARFEGRRIRSIAAALAVAALPGLTATAFAAPEPAAGKLRQPTAAENRTLVEGIQAMLKSAAPSPLKRFPDGTHSMVLGTSFLNISVAQAQNGTLRQVCIDNAQSAAALMNPAPAFEDK
jgi:protein-disulfide isomerase-like protein with CxxC motif